MTGSVIATTKHDHSITTNYTAPPIQMGSETGRTTERGAEDTRSEIPARYAPTHPRIRPMSRQHPKQAPHRPQHLTTTMDHPAPASTPVHDCSLGGQRVTTLQRHRIAPGCHDDPPATPAPRATARGVDHGWNGHTQPLPRATARAVDGECYAKVFSFI
jgi:hypothetical protein